MEQWEYLTLFLRATTRDRKTREYIRSRFNKKARSYSPESLIPELDRLGAEGWELVHMEPVGRVGGKEDVMLDPGSWTNRYFCVLKRRKPGSYVPIAVIGSQNPPQPQG
jgi:hypothetical protein